MWPSPDRPNLNSPTESPWQGYVTNRAVNGKGDCEGVGVTEGYTDLSPDEAEAVVSEFVDSLSEGRMIDALNLIATDAVLQDESGHEQRGIRAIAKSLLPYREPHAVDLEKIETAGTDVRVLFRRKKSRTLRGSFSVSQGRISSLRLESSV